MAVISVPPEKSSIICADIDRVLSTGTIALPTARKLRGRLQWYAQLAPYLRSYTGPLTAAIVYMERSGRQSTSVGKTLRADLSLWKVRISSLRCVILPQVGSAKVVCASDASTVGFGGWISLPLQEGGRSIYYFQSSIDSVPYSLIELLLSNPHKPSAGDITALELLAGCLCICLAVKLNLQLSSVVLLSDNEPSIKALRKRYSSAPRVSLLLRQLALFLSELPVPISYRVEHISGNRNLVADHLSRSLHTHRIPPGWNKVDITDCLLLLDPAI